MPDKLTPEQRHRNMAAIRGRDTMPEVLVRKFLWNHGFRYRLNHRRLPGRPDIVLRKYRTCIFVNGCFWHGHEVVDGVSSPCCKIPSSNRDFWLGKIVRNQVRDAEVKVRLRAMGWNCITVWECELRPDRREATLQSLALTLSQILLHHAPIRPYALGEVEETQGSLMVAEE